MAYIGEGTAGQVLQAVGTTGSAKYSTATYPATTTVSQILYSSATNVVGGITTANNSILSTDGSGIPTLGTSLSNDYTFTKATSGATTTLTVSNSSNTGSSAANIATSVAGGTAADPTHQFIVTGVTTWTEGADNSDSDAFVIAASATLGTTNVMRVATTGEINFPLQSSFLANLGTQDDNVTGDGTTYTVGSGNALTEIYDQNNDFATSTFTAPITGRYNIGMIVGYRALAAANTGSMSLVTSNRTYAFLGNVGAFANASGDERIPFSTMADMDAADTLTYTVSTSGGTKIVDIGITTYIYAHLEC